MMKIPRWLKRTGKWILYLLVAIVSLYVLACAWLSWSAKRDWQQTKKELEARGEKLSLADFIPPQIPDEVNFYSSPLFADIMPPRAKDHWREMKIKPLDGGNFIMSETKNRKDAKGLMNLEAFAVRLRTEENKNQSAATVILNAFKEKKNLWNALNDAAEKPEARFPAQYEKLFVTPLPHLTMLIACSSMLTLRAVAHMEAGESQEAERDIKLILRLSDSLSTEPFLISHLVRISCVRMASQSIWEGIERHVWTSEELEDFENQLASEKLLDGLCLAYRGERGGFNTLCSQMAQGNQSSGKELYSEMAQENQSSGKELFTWWPLIPWHWLYSDMAFYSRALQDRIDILTQPNGINKNTYSEVFIHSKRERLKHLLSAQIIPAISGAGRKFAETQSQIEMTRIACALERYKIACGVYPETLDALIPNYIEKLPNDVASAKPYHYRRNAPDKFTLWSVGFDGVDDNATPVAKAAEGEIEKGDWVWGVFTKK
ncbi:MAG: hypothetical protein ABIP97_06200 [Chthoniobacterales bacterium]